MPGWQLFDSSALVFFAFTGIIVLMIVLLYYVNLEKHAEKVGELERVFFHHIDRENT
jgi:hypothetical protein